MDTSSCFSHVAKAFWQALRKCFNVSYAHPELYHTWMMHLIGDFSSRIISRMTRDRATQKALFSTPMKRNGPLLDLMILLDSNSLRSLNPNDTWTCPWESVVKGLLGTLRNIDRTVGSYIEIVPTSISTMLPYARDARFLEHSAARKVHSTSST
jgi:hypothetical protein